MGKGRNPVKMVVSKPVTLRAIQARSSWGTLGAGAEPALRTLSNWSLGWGHWGMDITIPGCPWLSAALGEC